MVINAQPNHSNNSVMDPNFTEQREEFRENLTLGLIPALGRYKLEVV